MTPHNPFDLSQFMSALGGTPPAAAAAKATPVIPGLAAWAMPTVDGQELDKRIANLKAVLFWLEQNAAALRATVQALEVQKLTLATLSGMNLNMAEVARSFTAAHPLSQMAQFAQNAAMPDGHTRPDDVGNTAASQWPFQAQPHAAGNSSDSDGADAASAAPEAAAAGAALDPMQWWGALTQQFQHITAQAMQHMAQAAPMPATPKRTTQGSARGSSAKKSSVKGSAQNSASPKARPAAKTRKKAPSQPAPAAASPRKTTRRSGLGEGHWPLPGKGTARQA